jgi:hypothetical protein
VHDRTAVFGIASFAETTSMRWDYYSAIRRGENPEPLPNTPEVTGNFMEMPSWLVQTPQGRGEIPVDECVIFHEDISAGEELLLDYEEKYFLHRDKQLLHDCPLALRPVLFRIVSRLDPRVTEALEAHMRK